MLFSLKTFFNGVIITCDCGKVVFSKFQGSCFCFRQIHFCLLYEKKNGNVMKNIADTVQSSLTLFVSLTTHRVQYTVLNCFENFRIQYYCNTIVSIMVVLSFKLVGNYSQHSCLVITSRKRYAFKILSKISIYFKVKLYFSHQFIPRNLLFSSKFLIVFIHL